MAAAGEHTHHRPTPDFKRWSGSDCAPPDVRAGHQPSRGRAPAGHLTAERPPLAPPLATRRRAASALPGGPAGGQAGQPPPPGRTGLGQGALAHGFDSDLWTLQRVALVIERLTGVRHIPRSVAHPSGDGLDPPAAQRRASERDEEAIARWVKQDWPRIRQKRRRRGAWIVFLDESGVSFTPPVRRTWAPRGRTPVLRHRQRHWARLSMAAMCCYRPDGGRARLASTSSRAATTTSC